MTSIFSRPFPNEEDMNLFKRIIKFLLQRRISIFIQALFSELQWNGLEYMYDIIWGEITPVAALNSSSNDFNMIVKSI